MEGSHWIPLTNNHYATLSSGYTPTLDADPECKELFDASLESAISKASTTEKLIRLWDFNEGVGSDSVLWKDILGQHRVGKQNDNDLRLHTLCAQHWLVITDTIDNPTPNPPS